MFGQTLDDKGCITVNWPSKNVAHGGVFHSQKVNHSKEKADFLKVLIEESKLSTELRHRKWRLREDSPERWPSEGTAAGGDGYRRRSLTPPRPRTSRRRTLSCIRESGMLDMDDTWRPTERGEDRDILKQRLQELMEWGEKKYKQQKSPVPVDPPKQVKLPTTKEIRQELLTQIRERAEWLQDMEELGQAAPHRELIRDQIAERMRALAAMSHSARDAAGDTKETAQCSVHALDSSKSAVRGGSVKGSARGKIESTRTTALSRYPSAVNDSAKNSAHTAKSSGKAYLKRDGNTASVRARRAEENVAAYSTPSPLAYSPRRRS